MQCFNVLFMLKFNNDLSIDNASILQEAIHLDLEDDCVRHTL